MAKLATVFILILSTVFGGSALANDGPKTVFLGDSITWGLKWTYHFQEPVCNLAIPRTTVATLSKTVKVPTSAQQVFIMVGINDLLFGVDLQIILAHYEELLTRIQAQAPGGTIYVQSVLPASRPIWGNPPKTHLRDRIQEFNRLLFQLIATRSNVSYIDLIPLFADEEGWMIKTYGRIHLSRTGYLLWGSYLEGFVGGEVTADIDGDLE